MIFISTSTFISCEKSESNLADPKITFQNGINTFAFEGFNNIDVNITFAAEGLISKVTMIEPTSTGTQTVDITQKMDLNYTVNAAGKTSAVYFFKVTSNELSDLHNSVEYPIVYKFKVLDRQGKETSANFTVTGPTFTITKSGKFFNINAPVGQNGAYDLDGDSTVSASSSNNVKSLKNTDIPGATFTGSWTSGNNTYFAPANNYNFNAASVDDAIGLYNAAQFLGQVSNNVYNPLVGNIYVAFNAGKYYVIKITSINPSSTSKGNTGKITFDYLKEE